MTLFAIWQIWCLDNGREINIIEFSPQEFSSPACAGNVKRRISNGFV